ncbi:nucleotidyltransferase domain-containing protein [Candidatus Aerophobetes bacterium]|nr:nucleotidyltransferase domain-containing protein [Candidatus Aerophobetes bacterium]
MKKPKGYRLDSRKIEDPIILKFIKDSKNLRERIERIYLFGSRARGNEKPDSDYDLLIVADHPDAKFREKIYDIVIDILLETGKLISLKIFTGKEFRKLCQAHTPFMKNIQREGIRIG